MCFKGRMCFKKLFFPGRLQRLRPRCGPDSYMSIMIHIRTFLVAAGLIHALAAFSPAFAAQAQATNPGGGSPEALLLLQITLLILTGRLAGEVLQRIGLPAVMGQLLAGVLLGPSVFGLLWPEGQRAVFPHAPEQRAMLDAFSQVGILLLLLLAGMETDLSLVRKAKRQPSVPQSPASSSHSWPASSSARPYPTAFFPTPGTG